jgi:hypothetical protein
MERMRRHPLWASELVDLRWKQISLDATGLDTRTSIPGADVREQKRHLS